jgi:raffinose/stachyose/melibiose transport system substrate-binding protein
VNLGNPLYNKLLTGIVTMMKDGITPTHADSVSQKLQGSPIFTTGKAAFIIDGDWRQGAYLTDKSTGQALIPPAAQASDFELMNIPAIPGEKNPGVDAGIAGTGYGISGTIPAGSAKEAAAVKFIKYLYSPEVLKICLETGAFIPSRKGITSDKIEPFTTKLVAFYGSIPKATYVIDGVIDPGVNDVLQNGLQAIGSVEFAVKADSTGLVLTSPTSRRAWDARSRASLRL